MREYIVLKPIFGTIECKVLADSPEEALTKVKEEDVAGDLSTFEFEGVDHERWDEETYWSKYYVNPIF